MKFMCLFGLAFIVGCSASVDNVDDGNVSASEVIKGYAEQALEKCGKGNVHTVNIDGFICYKYD